MMETEIGKVSFRVSCLVWTDMGRVSRGRTAETKGAGGLAAIPWNFGTCELGTSLSPLSLPEIEIEEMPRCLYAAPAICSMPRRGLICSLHCSNAGRRRKLFGKCGPLSPDRLTAVESSQADLSAKTTQVIRLPRLPAVKSCQSSTSPLLSGNSTLLTHAI